MKLRSVRGTHDIFGEEIDKFNFISNIVSKNANLNQYKEIQTPIFEFSDLFAKPLGEHSDVVLKEMYSFEDRNNEYLTLRPEYTTPMIRAAITNNLLNDLPLKIFGIGPMFRRERPQRGRYRQFNQINFEENANLVRGLDYYCNTVFEYKSDNLGSQDTLLGGGRYDGLIKVLGGPDIPGIGWAAGIERIALLMESEKKISSTIHIAVTNEKFTDYFLNLQKYLSENRISYYWNYKYNLKKSFTKANTSSASYIIIIGENEFNGDFFTIKNLTTGEQKELKLNQILNHLNDKSR